MKDIGVIAFIGITSCIVMRVWALILLTVVEAITK